MPHINAAPPQAATGPLGVKLRYEDLPPPNTQRWVSRRKAEVVIAVNSGLLTLREACDRYNLSEEEFAAWSRSFRDLGLKGLRATRSPS